MGGWMQSTWRKVRCGSAKMRDSDQGHDVGRPRSVIKGSKLAEVIAFLQVIEGNLSAASLNS